MKVVVTGGAGFIGSHLAEALAKAGHKVVCLDNFAPYYARAIKEANALNFAARGIKLLELDLVTADLREVLAGVDMIFHLAAQPGLAKQVSFREYERNNVLATYKLLEAASGRTSPAYLIFVSTSSVYGFLAIGDETTAPTPSSYYGVTKLAAEQLALAYWRGGHLPVSVARLFSVYGERERPEKLYPKLIKSIFEGKPFPLYEGSDKHVRSYSYVGDIVAGLILMLGSKDKIVGEIFNLGTDETATTAEGIALIQEIMGRKVHFENIPARAGDQRETRANINKARQVLGYAPGTKLGEGLAREVRWFTDHPI